MVVNVNIIFKVQLFSHQMKGITREYWVDYVVNKCRILSDLNSIYLNLNLLL